MTSRRASAVVFSFLLASSAAAQIRPLPAEAGTAPLGVESASMPAMTAAPVLGAPLSGISLNAASSAAIFAAPAPELSASAPGALAARAPLAELVPQAAPRVLAAAPAALAPGTPVRKEEATPASSAGRGVARAADAFAPGNRRAASAEAAPEFQLDALFDGRAGRAALPAAAEGPERPDAAKPAALAPSRRARAWRSALIAVPAAALAAGAVIVAPHAALAAVHGLGRASYWLANPLAFLFTIPQIHRMLSRRSAEVSASMTVVGLLSALATALCFAFDGKSLMMYRNLAQTFGFAAMLALERRYARAPGKTLPSRRRALAETIGLVAVFGAVTLLAGPALLAATPAVAVMGSLLVPFQILAGFGFTYMMYAQLQKMSRDHSAGDSSTGMTWAFLGTKVIWIWSFATMLSLSTAPAWLTVAAGAVFAGACWLAARAVLSRLLSAQWTFLPEKLALRGRTLTRAAMSDLAAFAVLAGLILLLSGAGRLAFVSLLGIPAVSVPLFAMYLIYTVQNMVACEATAKTLRLQKSLVREGPPGRTLES